MEVSPQWITLVRYGATPMFRWDNQKRLGGIDMRIATYYKDVYHVFSLWRIWTSQLQQQSKNLAMVDVPGMWLFASLMGYLYSQVTEPIGSLIVLWSYKGMLYSYRRGLCIACSTAYGNAKAKMCGTGKWSVPALFFMSLHEVLFCIRLVGERKIHEKHWVMATFFSLLSTGISCIFYGIITTAVIMAILYFILKSLSRGIVKSIPFI